MRLQVLHLTRYDYATPVRFLPHQLCLRPRENPSLRIEDYRLTIRPEAKLRWMRDELDNLQATASFPVPDATLEMRSSFVVTTSDTNPFNFSLRSEATALPLEYQPDNRANLAPYLELQDVATEAALRRWVAGRPDFPSSNTVAWLFALSKTVQAAIAYRRRDEPGIQNIETTLALGSGSCRDLAVLFIGCVRTVGIAARFVSGYLFDPSADGDDSRSMHAWAEVYLPGAGWIGIDPTQGIFCDSAYVPVAHAVAPESVSPAQGSFSSAISTAATLSADIRIHRLAELIDQAPPPQPLLPCLVGQGPMALAQARE